MGNQSSHFTTTSKKHPVIWHALDVTGRAEYSLDAPKLLLSAIWPYLRPRSVGEFGCAYATFLHAARSLGATVVHGYDIPELDLSLRHLSEDEFTAVDLTEEIDLPQRFDLAVSTEVGEHLRAEGALTFADTLVKASDRVLFSSAVPFQGGVNHIHENWLEYWAQLFAERGYLCYDILRPQFWHDTRVPWYYRQNVVLFVKSGCDASLREAGHRPTARPATQIHPEHYLKVLAGQPVDIKILTSLIRALYRACGVATK